MSARELRRAEVSGAKGGCGRWCRAWRADRSDTPILAQSSYGIQKQISELYAYDYGRKGESMKPAIASEIEGWENGADS